MKRNITRWISIFCALLLMFTLAACQGSTSTETKETNETNEAAAQSITQESIAEITLEYIAEINGLDISELNVC